MQYSDYVLDTLTAPKLTSLTACGAVEVPALPDYDTPLKLNQLGGVRYNDNAKVLIMTFIRRLKTAISEYSQGRGFLEKYIYALPGNHLLEAQRVALSHFENSILQLHVAIVSLAALGGGPAGRPSSVDRNSTSLEIIRTMTEFAYSLTASSILTKRSRAQHKATLLCRLHLSGSPTMVSNAQKMRRCHSRRSRRFSKIRQKTRKRSVPRLSDGPARHSRLNRKPA